LRVAFFCPSSNTIVASDERLRKFYDNLGDYAVGCSSGSAYSEAVQRALGSALTGEPRWLADDCLGGAWTKALFPVRRTKTAAAISAGDLDEGIQTLVAIGDDRADTNELGSLVREDRCVPHGRARWP
jgi:hypothetical protein